MTDTPAEAPEITDPRQLRAVEICRRRLEGALKAVAECQTKIGNADPLTHLGHELSWADSLFVNTAWVEVLNRYLAAFSDPECSCEGIMETLQNEVLQEAARAASDSTSTCSNFYKRCLIAARAELYDKLRRRH